MSIFNYCLKISYNGSQYEGWQVQPDGHKTIQGCLNKALEKITKTNDVSSLGSGRTDSGVHALGQIVNVKIPLDLGPSNLKAALNSHLPKDIRVLEVTLSTEGFHPVADAKWKRYDYLITTADILPPHFLGQITHIPKKLNLDHLEKALVTLVGERDFERFSTKGTPVKSTVRTLYSASLSTEDWKTNPYGHESIKVLRLSFEGNGFLKQMVRLLVGSALNVALGKSSVEDLKNYLESSDTKKFGPVAAPDGLYLVHVEYNAQHPSLH